MPPRKQSHRLDTVMLCMLYHSPYYYQIRNNTTITEEELRTQNCSLAQRKQTTVNKFKKRNERKTKEVMRLKEIFQ